MRRGLGWRRGLAVPIGLAATLVVGDATPCAAASPAVVEYWTLAPNEGESAGGHAALVVDEAVHHVEHRGDGLIADRRDPRADFERRYRLEQNRSIEVLRLALPPAVAARLVERLDQRRLARSLRLDRLAALEAAIDWLDAVRERGTANVFVPAAGILESPGFRCADPAAAARDRLRGELEERLGAGVLTRQLVRARTRLRDAREWILGRAPRPDRPASDPSSSTGRRDDLAGWVDATGGAVGRLVDATLTVLALEAIRDCRGPEPDRIRTLSPLVPRAEAGAAERAGRDGLRREAPDALMDSLARLVRSDRPDPGLALVLAWSRLVVAEQAARGGELVVLDPFAEAAAPESLGTAAVPSEWLAARERTARRRLRERLATLSDTTVPLEARLFDVEAATHDLVHARRAERHVAPSPARAPIHAASVRYAGRMVDLPWASDGTLADLDRRRRALAGRREVLRRELETDLGYALFTRNCVTELLVLLDEVLATDPSTASFARDRARDPEAPLAFIPVVAGRVVARHAPVAERRRLPSSRELAVARARQDARGSAVGLRESNTLTAKAYHGHDDDSIFLFFSEAPIWARPLAGLGNLMTGAGGAALGLLSAPADGGTLLGRGLRGMAMSVPELFFFNVRKGTYPVAPPDPDPSTRREPIPIPPRS